MRGLLRGSAGILMAAASIASGCSSFSSGPSKIVVSEKVCANVHFLNMKLNKTNRLVVDNRKFTEGQNGLTIRLQNFPVVVQGAVPEGSVIGAKVSTIVLSAKTGEQAQVDLVPTFTGTYKATCAAAIQRDSVVTTTQQDIDFQIK